MVNNILLWWFSKRLNLSEGLVTAGSVHNVVTKIVGRRSTDVSGTEVADDDSLMQSDATD